MRSLNFLPLFGAMALLFSSFGVNASPIIPMFPTEPPPFPTEELAGVLDTSPILLPRPALPRAGVRHALKRERHFHFEDLRDAAGVPMTRETAGRPALMNRVTRRAHARRVRFLPA